jgi:hypothetical protein
MVSGMSVWMLNLAVSLHLERCMDAVWHRMPFDICPAPEVFQRKLQEALEGLDGVYPVADDILIVGEGDTDEEAIVERFSTGAGNVGFS